MSLLTVDKYYKTNVNDDEMEKMKAEMEKLKKENEELKEHLECEEDGYPCSDWFSDKLDFHIKYHFCNEGGEYYECLKDLKEKPNCLDDLIFGSVQRMKEEEEEDDKEKYGVCDCCDDILYENIPIFIWTNDKEDEKEVTICKECNDDCEEDYRKDGWICDEDEECGKCGQMFDREGYKLDDGMGCRECCG